MLFPKNNLSNPNKFVSVEILTNQSETILLRW